MKNIKNKIKKGLIAATGLIMVAHGCGEKIIEGEIIDKIGINYVSDMPEDYKTYEDYIKYSSGLVCGTASQYTVKDFKGNTYELIDQEKINGHYKAVSNFPVGQNRSFTVKRSLFGSIFGYEIKNSKESPFVKDQNN